MADAAPGASAPGERGPASLELAPGSGELAPSSGGRAPTSVELAPALAQELIALASAGYPHETCGLLLGRPRAGGAHVVRIVVARNVESLRAHDRYVLDPASFLAADRQARAEGLEIIGIWHTHPDHPARPSPTDLAAAWDGYSYVIVSVRSDGACQLRCWRLVGTEFLEESVIP
jgi:proteasome lid subunit RPN8/RPN11